MMLTSLIQAKTTKITTGQQLVKSNSEYSHSKINNDYMDTQVLCNANCNNTSEPCAQLLSVPCNTKLPSPETPITDTCTIVNNSKSELNTLDLDVMSNPKYAAPLKLKLSVGAESGCCSSLIQYTHLTLTKSLRIKYMKMIIHHHTILMVMHVIDIITMTIKMIKVASMTELFYELHR